MIKWLGLENYDNIEIDTVKNLHVQGLVVGDPFCSYRMFQYGDVGLFDFIRYIEKINNTDNLSNPSICNRSKFQICNEYFRVLVCKSACKKNLSSGYRVNGLDFKRISRCRIDLESLGTK